MNTTAVTYASQKKKKDKHTEEGLEKLKTNAPEIVDLDFASTRFHFVFDRVLNERLGAKSNIVDLCHQARPSKQKPAILVAGVAVGVVCTAVGNVVYVVAVVGPKERLKRHTIRK